MKEIIEIIMNLSVTAFAIYGVYVLIKWKKAADKVNKMCDEMHEEINSTGEGGYDAARSKGALPFAGHSQK